MYPRFFKYLKSQSIFLLGPRGTGKSTWLKNQFQDSVYFDLLDESLFQDLLRDPQLFKQKLNLVMAKNSHSEHVIVDEIQRLPSLLNYVQKAIVEDKLKFILTGSSARKLKRDHANLLAGRAITRSFNPLTALELGKDFDLTFSLKFGHLPAVFSAESPLDYLKSYVGTYLREEVQQEALVRNLATFARFMESAAFSQAQVLSVQSLASDVGVDRKTAESYVQILEDLLIANRIPVFQKRSKRKMTTKPKFYYFDVGVYRTLKKQGPLDPIEEVEGAALETLVYQELKGYVENNNIDLEIFFYRTQNKHEVDFVLYGPQGFFAIEVKRSSKLRNQDLEHIKEFKQDYKNAKCLFFYLGSEEYLTDDKIHIVPLQKALLSLDKLLQY